MSRSLCTLRLEDLSPRVSQMHDEHPANSSPITIVNAPTPRAAHSAVFTRIDGTDQMIVWGG